MLVEEKKLQYVFGASTMSEILWKKFYIIPNIHIRCVCVCEINSFREEIKVKTDAGQKDDKFFTSCHEKLCAIYL